MAEQEAGHDKGFFPATGHTHILILRNTNAFVGSVTHPYTHTHTLLFPHGTRESELR